MTVEGVMQDALLSSKERTEAGCSAERCCRAITGREGLAGKGLTLSSARAALQRPFVRLLGCSLVLGNDDISADLRQAPAPAGNEGQRGTHRLTLAR